MKNMSLGALVNLSSSPLLATNTNILSTPCSVNAAEITHAWGNHLTIQVTTYVNILLLMTIRYTPHTILQVTRANTQNEQYHGK